MLYAVRRLYLVEIQQFCFEIENGYCLEIIMQCQKLSIIVTSISIVYVLSNLFFSNWLLLNINICCFALPANTRND